MGGGDGSDLPAATLPEIWLIIQEELKAISKDFSDLNQSNDDHIKDARSQIQNLANNTKMDMKNTNNGNDMVNEP